MTPKTVRLCMRLQNEVEPHIKRFELATHRQQQGAEATITEWVGSVEARRQWSTWFRNIGKKMTEFSNGQAIYPSDIPGPPDITWELQKKSEQTTDKTAKIAATAWIKAAKIVLEEGVYEN